LTTKSDGVDITGELQADSLDIDGNADITGTLNTHTIPGGTGTIALTSDIPTNNTELTNGAGYITDANLTIVGDDSTGVTFSAKDNDDITITGTGGITSTVSGNTITIDGSGVSGGAANTGDITFVGSTMSSPSNANFTIETAGTGKIILTGITFPDTDGTADQILGTNGSGVLSFRDPTAINIDGGTADSVYTSVPTIDGGTA
jgi:cytoskeletal protein CcmA (bactofilin family)